MDIEFNCNKCGQHIAIDEAGAGLTVQCPKCGQSLTVPQQSPPQASSISPPIAQPSTNLQNCPDCGRQISKRAASCPHCGAPNALPVRGEAPTQAAQVSTRTWNPGVAAVMSFIIPGLGQLYKGQFGAAFGFFFGVPLCYFFGWVTFSAEYALVCIILFVSGVGLHFACIADAYKSSYPEKALPVRGKAPISKRAWTPAGAALMSCLLPGLGQLYKRQFGAAFGFFFGFSLCNFGFLLCKFFGCTGFTEATNAVICCALYLGCIAHAYMSSPRSEKV